MPRVNVVEKARKADPRNGIKVGDKYYWWKFKNQRGPGTVVKSLKPPRPSQLTRSSFKSQWRAFAEEMQDLALDDGLYEALQDIAGRIRELGEEQQGNLDNMPEGLQQGDTGTMLQERIDNCETWAGEIEGLEDPGEFNETEVEDLRSFDDFLDEEDDADPPPNGEDYGGEQAPMYFADAFHDWAARQWSDYGAEVQAKIEEARADYDGTLESLKEEAINADPGEV